MGSEGNVRWVNGPAGLRGEVEVELAAYSRRLLRRLALFLAAGGLIVEALSWTTLSLAEGRAGKTLLLLSALTTLLLIKAWLCWTRAGYPVAASEATGELRVWPFLLNVRKAEGREAAWGPGHAKRVAALLTAAIAGITLGFAADFETSPSVIVLVKVLVLVGAFSWAHSYSRRGFRHSREWRGREEAAGIELCDESRRLFFPKAVRRQPLSSEEPAARWNPV